MSAPPGPLRSSPLKTSLRVFLVSHGLFNITQGAFSVFKPGEFASAAGPMLQGANDDTIRSIGLGSIGVGVYSTAGALANDRRFFALTALLRVVFAAIILTQWSWESGKNVVTYEATVAVAAAFATFL